MLNDNWTDNHEQADRKEELKMKAQLIGQASPLVNFCVCQLGLGDVGRQNQGRCCLVFFTSAVELLVFFLPLSAIVGWNNPRRNHTNLITQKSWVGY